MNKKRISKIFVIVLLIIYILFSTTAIVYLFYKQKTVSTNSENLKQCYENANLKLELSNKINCSDYNYILDECDGIYINKTKFDYQNEIKKCYELYK